MWTYHSNFLLVHSLLDCLWEKKLNKSPVKMKQSWRLLKKNYVPKVFKITQDDCFPHKNYTSGKIWSVFQRHKSVPIKLPRSHRITLFIVIICGDQGFQHLSTIYNHDMICCTCFKVLHWQLTPPLHIFEQRRIPRMVCLQGLILTPFF